MSYPLGAVILEPGSSVKHKTGSWRTKRPVHDESKCNRCGLCWVYCPESAVNPDDFSVDLNYCKGCGICANECPVKAIEMVEG